MKSLASRLFVLTVLALPSAALAQSSGYIDDRQIGRAHV